MKNLSPILVFACCLLGAACSKQSDRQSSQADQQITFGPKVFSDTGEHVYVTGSLMGDDVPNNSVVINCEQQRMECVTCSVYQIGENQIGRLEAPISYPVTKWDDYEIIAEESAGPLSCLKTTISIKRESQESGTTVWVQEPINQTSTYCKEQNDLVRKAGLRPQRLRKFTIEDSPAWRRIHAQK
jgi:hypothetical protein